MCCRSTSVAYQNLPLNVISWNISNAQPSFSAPDFTKRSQDSPRLIREECLQSSIPSVIALQECPYPNFGSELFTSLGYVSAGTRQSHCGYCDLLVQNELISNNKKIQSIQLPNHLPSVAAKIELPNKTQIAVSSSHLQPFKEGANKRLLQCMSLMDCMTKESNNCILLGDMNMRVSEDKDVEGAGLVDCWKAAGSSKDTKFTWNSYTNKYNEGCFEYTARYDRCYVYGDVFRVKEFGFIGNCPVMGNKGDYLSDHFGLRVGIDIT